VRNCDPDLWDAYFDVEMLYRETLDVEYVDTVERASWRMAMFCYKKSSLDRGASRLIRVAVENEPPERHLVFGVGAAGFASTGRGELPAPTAEVTRALERALKREERLHSRRVVRMKVDEFRTTMCCCACGAVTEAAWVTKRGERMRSRRLRSCTSCETAGKLRDRDVQGARNILWATLHEYYGHERPQYLKRSYTRGQIKMGHQA